MLIVIINILMIKIPKKLLNFFPKTALYIILGGALSILIGVGIVQAITSMTVTDTYTDSTKIASATNVTVDTVNGQIYLSQAAAWSCGSSLFDTRDGKSYNTVLIGSQCWMQQNLNVGTMVNQWSNQGFSTTSIQKYCWGNGETNCTTYGGLYQWDQAMGGSVTSGTRGICPSSWHLPTHYEWVQLERAICTSASCSTDFPYDYSTNNAWRGSNEGTLLKSGVGLFKGILAGYRHSNGNQYELGSSAFFWTSNGQWFRQLGSAYSQVYRYNVNDRYYALSIRCVKD